MTSILPKITPPCSKISLDQVAVPSETGCDPVIELNRSSPKLSFRGDEIDFHPVRLCPVRAFCPLVWAQSTIWITKTEEEIGILGKILGMKNEETR